MDIHMPEMDGVAATQQIRSTFPDHMQPIIIALTADAMDQHKEEYLADGMDGYLTKQIRITELTNAIDQAIQEGRAV